MKYVLRQHNENSKKERAIYYLSKKFLDYEVNHSQIKNICCPLVWTAKKLKQYMLYHTTWLITKINPIKYLFEGPALPKRITR